MSSLTDSSTLRSPVYVTSEGINANSFDGRGNYSTGIKEQLIFPEIEYDKVDKVRGMDINFVTTAKTDEEAKELLKLDGRSVRKVRGGYDKWLKKSMIIKAAARSQSTLLVLTTDARSAADLMPICESSASAVSASENWLMKVRFRVLRRQAGKISAKEAKRYADY